MGLPCAPARGSQRVNRPSCRACGVDMRGTSEEDEDDEYVSEESEGDDEVPDEPDEEEEEEPYEEEIVPQVVVSRCPLRIADLAADMPSERSIPLLGARPRAAAQPSRGAVLARAELDDRFAGVQMES